MQPSIPYAELGATLARIGMAEEPAEYHGALCGALCVKPPEQIDLLHLLVPGELPAADAPDRTMLAQLCRQALVALQDDQLSFTPLLPADEAALVPRVRALAAWCEGFLFGLASRPNLDLEKCSEDAREIIRDFAQFTHAGATEEAEAELEETAYTELVEYIRVGAQLIYMELRPAPTPQPVDTQALH